MKKLSTLALILVCSLICIFGTVKVATVKAEMEEEIQETENEKTLSKEEIEEIADKVLDAMSNQDNASKIKAIISIIKNQDTTEKKIIVGCVVAVFVIIILLVFLLLKKSGKANISVAKASEQLKANEDLKKIINAIDLDNLPESISNVVISQTNKIIETIKPEYKTYAESNAKLDEIMAMLDIFKTAMSSVWKNDEVARKTLAINTTNSALKDVEEENAKLKAEIRAIKGEEAEKIINSTKGE